jgi:hypothetical protein
VIPEQLMQPQFRVLRNSLTLFEDGVRSVRLRTDRAGTEAALGRDREESVVEYDGDRYAVEVRPPDGGSDGGGR